MRLIAVVVGALAIATSCAPDTSRGAQVIRDELVGGIALGMTAVEAGNRAGEIAEGAVQCNAGALPGCEFRRGGDWPGTVTYRLEDGVVSTILHRFDDPAWQAVRPEAIAGRIEALAGEAETQPDGLLVWRDRAADQAAVLGCGPGRGASGAPCMLMIVRPSQES